jgi:glycine betaine/choline ABC-type transport system substrate-binding protein/ABC-type proline/glycine betaine transport system permease subunit
MKNSLIILVNVLIVSIIGNCLADDSGPVKIGSKKFTESVILGEIINYTLESRGIVTEHKKELGGTRVLWSALLNGDIDMYPEYTGTIIFEILADENIIEFKALKERLNEKGIGISNSLGFNNTYALGMKTSEAKKYNITRISDLRNFPDLIFGFSNEVMDREDGWKSWKRKYNLPQTNVCGMDHDLAYRGLENGNIHLTDLYSTDAEIEYYNIKTLTDDLEIFPDYYAVILYRLDILKKYPSMLESIQLLESSISEQKMIVMNASAKLNKKPESEIAANFLDETFGIKFKNNQISFFSRLIRHTKEHLFLVSISLLAAILISIPLGIIAAKLKKTGQIILSVVGILQTIPSLALLVFMIPLLGIGGPPAILALFLYSLLPIVRNTYSGLQNIPPEIRESAIALGLPFFARLKLIEFPMALSFIISGIKTSAVINIGTATLGALIGAGGYGQPILTGIRLDDIFLILEGAIPAALLAIFIQYFFEIIEKLIVSKGLQTQKI